MLLYILVLQMHDGIREKDNWQKVFYNKTAALLKFLRVMRW